EFGYANYEIIPTPQIAANPLTDMSNQFSIELGLTAQQRQQILPILKQELKQLQGLQKDTALGALKKVERLREIGSAFDTPISPLLNAEQQPKFQALREQMRRHLIETLGSETLHAVERKLEKKL